MALTTPGRARRIGNYNSRRSRPSPQEALVPAQSHRIRSWGCVTAGGMESRTADGCFLGDVGACGAPPRVLRARGSGSPELGVRSWGVGKRSRTARAGCRLSGTVEVNLMALALGWMMCPLNVCSGALDGPCLEGHFLKEAGSGDPRLSYVVSVPHPFLPRPPARPRAGHYLDATTVGLPNCRLTARALAVLRKIPSGVR